MRKTKTYFLWAISITGFGFILSMVVTVGLLTGFIVPLIISRTLRIIPLSLLVISSLCIIAGIALLAFALTVKDRN
jgi:hypothetical protein